MNALKGFRAVATRYEKRACVFHGSVLVAALRLSLRGRPSPDAPAGPAYRC